MMAGMYRNLLCISFTLLFFQPFIIAQDEEEKTKKEGEIPKCTDLISPETSQEVADLRACIRAKNNAIQQKNQNNKIQNSVRRDRELRESKSAPFCLYDHKKNSCERTQPAPPTN